jgi:hypothetical protein
MALICKIITENTGSIKLRATNVVTDVLVDGDYLQLRAYAEGDNDRERGASQNLQFTKEKAIEFRDILNRFIEDSE